MIRTDNRFIIKPQNIPEDGREINKQRSILIGFLKEGNSLRNIYLFASQKIREQDEREVHRFNDATGGIASFLTQANEWPLIELWNAELGYFIDYEKFVNIYSKISEDIKNMSQNTQISESAKLQKELERTRLCQEFGRATVECYKKNLEVLRNIKTQNDMGVACYPQIYNIISKHPAILQDRTMRPLEKH